MKAKDTVIIMLPIPTDKRAVVKVVKAQAEISFPAGEKQGIQKGRREGIQSVIDYLKNEIDTVEERSAGEPELKAHFNTMERGTLGTVVYVLEEWQALKEWGV